MILIDFFPTDSLVHSSENCLDSELCIFKLASTKNWMSRDAFCSENTIFCRPIVAANSLSIYWSWSSFFFRVLAFLYMVYLSDSSDISVTTGYKEMRKPGHSGAHL